MPPHELVAYAGWTAIALGVLLMLWAAWEMLRHRTTINPYGRPSSLLQTGPFGFSRNPIYLADTLLLIGVGLVSGITWFLPLALIAAFITKKVAIDKEERWLHDKFGKRYRDYAKRVRRWI